MTMAARKQTVTPPTPWAHVKNRGSIRLSIVEQALIDAQERLRDMTASPRSRELRAKAEGYERALRAWVTRPPTEEQRQALLKLVLELNVEVIALGRSTP
jgi:hypothetical protein